MKVYEGKLVAHGARIGIVASRFNESITAKLLGGAQDALLRHEVREEDIEVAWVPGAFELPLMAAKMARSGRYDEAAKGIASVGLETGVPVLFGVVTTETIEQAIERAGTKAGNKGYDCAVSALEMVDLLHTFAAG